MNLINPKIRKIKHNFNMLKIIIKWIRKNRVYFGKSLASVPDGAMVIFPCRLTTFCCGLAGIVAFKHKSRVDRKLDLQAMRKAVEIMQTRRLSDCQDDNLDLAGHYLGGGDLIKEFLAAANALKGKNEFYAIFTSKENQAFLKELSGHLDKIISSESQLLKEQMGRLTAADVNVLAGRIEDLRDIAWCLSSEISANVTKTRDLMTADESSDTPTPQQTFIYKNINAVLNSIDRLEVRGRDSAGISLMFMLDKAEHLKFDRAVIQAGLQDQLRERSTREVMVNGDISINEISEKSAKAAVAITFTYKIAAEIGRLGDNIRFLRQQIHNDRILHELILFPNLNHTVSSHTRWASVGAITEANCHPVDNGLVDSRGQNCGIMHVCLNGDIDNYLELRAEHEAGGIQIHESVTTDTKIIPLQIQKYIAQGHDIEEAFRLAVNDFEGSHAISMHSDLAPGKVFLAQRGSGQAIFVGIAEDHYMPSSEVYGFIEETRQFIKMEGESATGLNGQHTQGQIFILSQESDGGLDGIRAMRYDGTLIELGADDIKNTELTSRDIDRQEYPHYFLKEISESPNSVEMTLQNRWKINPDNESHYVISLDRTIIPEKLETALVKDQIKRIFFIGQGTAGVAALACSNILNHYVNNPSLQTTALKASEFSGFSLNEDDAPASMSDTLVIAISQSGTTTDTNRTVDMAKERGAYTLAIVNRRDSDITFKVDGVMYTSSGRDIEMSVASTKAFYSQIIAGAILSLYFARLMAFRNDAYVTEETKRLLEIPSHMRKVLQLRREIESSARQLAVTKTYWAAVGSGPNKASSDEIRIKLSELCYKTISSDYVEDKKHIDLSSEPLIIVCAAGTRGTVIGDIIKDTAIFKAHKATPVVITDEGEQRFGPYADAIFHVPAVSEHLAPILNTLVGHIWGYYAALAINEGSRFLFGIQEDVQKAINTHIDTGLDVYEIIIEKDFREKVAFFYKEFRKKCAESRFPTKIGAEGNANLFLLMKYLSGRLPVSDFELDFGLKGTAVNMINTFFQTLSDSISYMARPVDAIKHQAKTVTVGTSRISEKLDGVLFDTIKLESLNFSQLASNNIIVIKNLQQIVARVEGSILYRIENLNLLGEPVEESTIEVLKKRGSSKSIPSRVETDTKLKGTKRIIVQQGNVYIGKGRKDDRSILVIPILSGSASQANQAGGHLLLLHVSFKEQIDLSVKTKALGGKYEHIKSIVQENSIQWSDRFIDQIEIEELFGRSAEKIGELIVSHQSPKPKKKIANQ